MNRHQISGVTAAGLGGGHNALAKVENGKKSRIIRKISLNGLKMGRGRGKARKLEEKWEFASSDQIL